MIEPFSAALLAGGRSRRMGEDKALLEIEFRSGDAPQPLWRWQLERLRSTGPAQLLLSRNPDQAELADPGAHVEAIADRHPDCGPLGGLASCLQACTETRLLVLAVDVPLVPMHLLEKLLRHRGGIVPRNSSGYFEPLTAVYPRACLEIAEQLITDGDLSMQNFVRRSIDAGLVEALELDPDEEHALGQNLNTPDELSDFSSRF